MKDTTILRKNLNMVTRVIDDETILMPVYKTSDEINCIYTLNKAATRIWKLVDGKSPLGTIKKHILKEFDSTAKEIAEEMDKFLRDLEEIKAIEFKREVRSASKTKI